jgi:FixJ family two-component response regulator
MRMSIKNSVVVVEDDPSLSQAIARIVRLAGLTPVTYESAEAMLAGSGAEEAKCMIVEVQLPGMGGFALRDRLSGARDLPPIVFMASSDEPEARRQAATASGKSFFLVKPFSGRMLLETIRRAASN